MDDRRRDSSFDPDPADDDQTVSPDTDTTFRHDPPVGGDVTEPSAPPAPAFDEDSPLRGGPRRSAPSAPQREASPQREPVPLREPPPQRASAPPRDPAAPRDHLPGDAAPSPTLARGGWAPQSSVTDVQEEETEDESAYAEPMFPLRGTFTLLSLIWIVFWVFAMRNVLNHPFDRKMDWNTSYFSIAARNLDREGFWKLHGGIYLTAGEGFEPAQREFYSGHPPLTAWLLAGWMKFMGPAAQSDWAIRALPLVFTTLNLCLLWLLVRRVFGAGAALVTTIIASVLPMIAFYAQNVNMEPFVMTFMLGASLGYLSYAKNGSKFGLIFMCVCVLLGCWTDWPMYVFSGFLGAAHLFKRRDLVTVRKDGTLDSADGEKARRGVLASMALVALPVLAFSAFAMYLKMNGSSLETLQAGARQRMTSTAEGSDKPSVMEGYKLLGSYFRWVDNGKPNVPVIKEFKTWFLDLFTLPALVLAVFGVLFFPAWSRRLSKVSGEAARRAVFRIVFCMLLTQFTYTLVFPQGAWEHEFWQYYLAVPVAILGGGLLAWLTMAGGAERKFRHGLFDRLGWATAALIPVMAIGPLAWRLHLAIPGSSIENHGSGLYLEYRDPLKQHTKPNDLIVTDLPDNPDDGGKGIQKALPWYADRYILTQGMGDHDTTNPQEVEAILKRFPNRRVIYLWEDNGGEAFFEYLNKKPYPRYEIPVSKNRSMIVYLLQGQPEATWRKAGIQSGPATPPPGNP